MSAAGWELVHASICATICRAQVCYSSMLSGLPCAQLAIAMDRIENDDDVSQSTQLANRSDLSMKESPTCQTDSGHPVFHHREQDLKESCGRTAVLQGLFLVKRLV